MEKFLLKSIGLKNVLTRSAIIAILFLLCSQKNSVAQTGSVGIGTETPNTKAILDVVSTTKGIMVPRLTSAQRTVLQADGVTNTTINGLLIYNSTTNRYNFWLNDKWYDLSDGPMGP
ncbi:MAG: hypothetical protein ABI390_03615, partial [Daejeonella sp.]